jgi:hypothetical protein
MSGRKTTKSRADGTPSPGLEGTTTRKTTNSLQAAADAQTPETNPTTPIPSPNTELEKMTSTNTTLETIPGTGLVTPGALAPTENNDPDAMIDAPNAEETNTLVTIEGVTPPTKWYNLTPDSFVDVATSIKHIMAASLALSKTDLPPQVRMVTDAQLQILLSQVTEGSASYPTICTLLTNLHEAVEEANQPNPSPAATVTAPQANSLSSSVPQEVEKRPFGSLLIPIDHEIKRITVRRSQGIRDDNVSKAIANVNCRTTTTKQFTACVKFINSMRHETPQKLYESFAALLATFEFNACLRLDAHEVMATDFTKALFVAIGSQQAHGFLREVQPSTTISGTTDSVGASLEPPKSTDEERYLNESVEVRNYLSTEPMPLDNHIEGMEYEQYAHQVTYTLSNRFYDYCTKRGLYGQKLYYVLMHTLSEKEEQFSSEIRGLISDFIMEAKKSPTIPTNSNAGDDYSDEYTPWLYLGRCAAQHVSTGQALARRLQSALFDARGIGFNSRMIELCQSQVLDSSITWVANLAAWQQAARDMQGRPTTWNWPAHLLGFDQRTSEAATSASFIATIGSTHDVKIRQTQMELALEKCENENMIDDITADPQRATYWAKRLVSLVPPEARPPKAKQNAVSSNKEPRNEHANAALEGNKRTDRSQGNGRDKRAKVDSKQKDEERDDAKAAEKRKGYQTAFDIASRIWKNRPGLLDGNVAKFIQQLIRRHTTLTKMFITEKGDDNDLQPQIDSDNKSLPTFKDAYSWYPTKSDDHELTGFLQGVRYILGEGQESKSPWFYAKTKSSCPNSTKKIADIRKACIESGLKLPPSSYRHAQSNSSGSYISSPGRGSGRGKGKGKGKGQLN